MKATPFLAAALLLVACAGCRRASDDVRKQADAFLADYCATYQKLYTASSKAQWIANTDISSAHDSATIETDKSFAAFTGSKDVIARCRALLAKKDLLTNLQRLQIEKIFRIAAHRPGTIPETVDSLIAAEAKETSALFGYTFRVRGAHGAAARIVTPNEIDRILLESRNLDERRAVWEASKEVGAVLKPGLAELRRLRNRVAREMGYRSYFDLEVSDYGMTTKEMMDLMDTFDAELRPLYRELHTYVRYELAARYHRPVPDLIPAHWLTNRWAQNWPGLVDAVHLEAGLAGRSREWIVKRAEDFYVSLGFPRLNEGFWKRSDLYPPDSGSGRKKNTHASAWHLDLDGDYRSLMSVEPTFEWFETTHHELGHIYYYISYSRPEIPLLLREGANRGFHEAVGDLMAIAASQKPYLEQVGILPKNADIDRTQWLLHDALASSSVVFIPFAAGTMTHFEHDLYEDDLPVDRFNARWWEYVRRFQGVEPPSPRGEEYCDAASKTHIINDPAQYYDYAVSCVLKFQLHDYIARHILHADPHNCTYAGNTAVGDFLRDILRRGQTEDWRKLLREKTGEDLSARAMLDYYRPLLDYLRKANAGRTPAL